MIVMKRVAVTSGDNLREFVKEGTGSLRFQGKIIKPGQRFLADPALLPKAFMDVIRPVGKLNGVASPSPENVEKAEYILKSRGGGGWFDVVHATTGKVINEKALKRQAALELIESLEQ